MAPSKTWDARQSSLLKSHDVSSLTLPPTILIPAYAAFPISTPHTVSLSLTSMFRIAAFSSCHIIYKHCSAEKWSDTGMWPHVVLSEHPWLLLCLFEVNTFGWHRRGQRKSPLVGCRVFTWLVWWAAASLHERYILRIVLWICLMCLLTTLAFAYTLLNDSWSCTTFLLLANFHSFRLDHIVHYSILSIQCFHSVLQCLPISFSGARGTGRILRQ